MVVDEKETRQFLHQTLKTGQKSKTITLKKHPVPFQFLFHLLQSKHPTWKNNLKYSSDVDAFRLERNKHNPHTILLHLKTTQTRRFRIVSWKQCFAKEISPTVATTHNRQKAMRTAIRPQIRKWRRLNPHPVCQQWSSDSDKPCSTTFEVDHHEQSFEELRQKFESQWIESRGKETLPTEFQWNRACIVRCRKRDSDFVKAWQRFHRKNASLQWLCSVCNKRKG